jgi:NAD/NADP transhydrogenase beta subunit
MPQMMELWLVIHVLLGLAGTLWYGGAWLGVERKDMAVTRIQHYTLYGLVAIALSWLTGGLYYTNHYGAVVKASILAGKYPWAHAFFTEYKEHLFLFVPLVALAVTITIWTMGDRIWKQPELHTVTAKLIGVVVTIGALMALMGVVISGAVR